MISKTKCNLCGCGVGRGRKFVCGDCQQAYVPMDKFIRVLDDLWEWQEDVSKDIQNIFDRLSGHDLS